MPITKCHVCSGDQLRQWCPGLLECTNCSHVQANMQLSDNELANLYGHKYFHGDEYVDYDLEKTALEQNFKRRINQLRQKAPNASTLFEVGCAYGYFLQAASKDYKVSGCDISEHAIQIAKETGLNAVCQDYLDIPAPEQPYDIICMWDTIEHIAKPRDYIEKARKELAPGGIFIATTGDAGSRVARFRREKWRMVHPPTHLHYFTADSMKTMLQNAGFIDVSISHDPFTRNIGTSLEKIRDLSGNKILRPTANFLAKSPIRHLTVPVNLYDIMTVTARLK